LCVLAGTTLHVRALDPAWRQPPVSSFRRPTTSGRPG
jgi:hypothetical protein